MIRASASLVAALVVVVWAVVAGPNSALARKGKTAAPGVRCSTFCLYAPHAPRARLMPQLPRQPAPSYCDVVAFPVPPCTDPRPRDALFLVDASNSMNRLVFYSNMLDYTLALFCAFSCSMNQHDVQEPRGHGPVPRYD